MKRVILRCLVALVVVTAAGWAVSARLPGVVAVAAADEGWKSEFEEICSKTQDAMSIPVPELQKLLERCDKLKPQIEALEASPRKVYLKRLKLCRDLFAYMLESKGKEQSKE